MSTLVKVIDETTQTVLFTCPIEDMAEAYAYAQKMEDLGLSVQVISPSITRTLADSLGIHDERLNAYEESVTQEMEDHDCSSCATTPYSKE